jgi:hypothetical protein
MINIDRQRVAAVQKLEALGYRYLGEEWVPAAAVTQQSMLLTAESDALHGALVRRADALEPVDEGQSVREPARVEARSQPSTGYFDRDGNPIMRKNPTYRDEFNFREDEIPEGYAYQWIRLRVHGQGGDDFSELHDMQENGWRPVPHERHKGRFGPTFLTWAPELSMRPYRTNGFSARSETSGGCTVVAALIRSP